MRFFFSGELDAQIADDYRPVRRLVESVLNASLSSKEYGGVINEIAIIPIILGPSFSLNRKERCLVRKGEQAADYRLFIDFEEFRCASEKERVVLLVRNVLEAVGDIQRKLKKSFDGQQLRNDILLLFPEVED